MTTELWTLLGFSAILLATIMMQSMAFTAKNGMGATLKSRDETPADPGLLEPRLARAARNGMEAMVIYAPLVLVAHVAGVSNNLTVLGAIIFLIARALHPVLYALGAVPFRTMSWSISIGGLAIFAYGFLSGAGAV